MADASLQARIDALPWYHEFDFGGGLHARSRSPEAPGHRRVWAFIERQLDQVDFRGKSVLDIGCWDGYWSFQAERRGRRASWPPTTARRTGPTGRPFTWPRNSCGRR